MKELETLLYRLKAEILVNTKLSEVERLNYANSIGRIEEQLYLLSGEQQHELLPFSKCGGRGKLGCNCTKQSECSYNEWTER
tara:strand:- start:454 stop:699 length:246 start_codon:yes stop_codon:yes gene_type:complete